MFLSDASLKNNILTSSSSYLQAECHLKTAGLDTFGTARTEVRNKYLGLSEPLSEKQQNRILEQLTADKLPPVILEEAEHRLKEWATKVKTGKERLHGGTSVDEFSQSFIELYRGPKVAVLTSREYGDFNRVRNTTRNVFTEFYKNVMEKAKQDGENPKEALKAAAIEVDGYLAENGFDAIYRGRAAMSGEKLGEWAWKASENL